MCSCFLFLFVCMMCFEPTLHAQRVLTRTFPSRFVAVLAGHPPRAAPPARRGAGALPHGLVRGLHEAHGAQQRHGGLLRPARVPERRGRHRVAGRCLHAALGPGRAGRGERRGRLVGERREELSSGAGVNVTVLCTGMLCISILLCVCVCVYSFCLRAVTAHSTCLKKVEAITPVFRCYSFILRKKNAHLGLLACTGRRCARENSGSEHCLCNMVTRRSNFPVSSQFSKQYL